jgi:hypothetical protein
LLFPSHFRVKLAAHLVSVGHLCKYGPAHIRNHPQKHTKSLAGQQQQRRTRDGERRTSEVIPIKAQRCRSKIAPATRVNINRIAFYATQNRRFRAYQVIRGDSSTPGDIVGVLSLSKASQSHHVSSVNPPKQQWVCTGNVSGTRKLTRQTRIRRPWASRPRLLQHEHDRLHQHLARSPPHIFDFDFPRRYLPRPLWLRC